MILSTVFSAFIMGFLGSAHCLGMCGGITIALNQTLEKKRHLRLNLTYQLFRILSYGLLGILVASIGFAFNQLSSLPILTVFSGLLMIMLGFYLLSWWSILQHFESLGRRLWQRLAPFQKKFIPIKSYRQAMVIGLLWGLLPCGLVYSALAIAATSATPIEGAASMLAFGLGTLPALLLTGTLSRQVLAFFKKKSVRAVFGLVFIAWGALQIYTRFSGNPHQHHHAPQQQTEDADKHSEHQHHH